MLSVASGIALARSESEGSRSADSSVPVYAAHRFSGPIAIDGNLNDAAWQKAEVATLAFPWSGQSGKPQATRVRLLWDDSTLYFAFECDDSRLTTQYVNRDDPTYEDDAVEIFLNPFPKRTEYVGMEINAKGVLYDYLYVHPHKLYANYDLKHVRLASRPRDGSQSGWTIEAAVPLANFVDKWDHAPVLEHTVWTMNLARWDDTEPNRVFSIWSDPGLPHPNPHEPRRFGILKFLP